MIIKGWSKKMSDNSHNNEKSENQDQVQIFLKLFSVYQHRIYGYIMSLVGDWNHADDIYQETMSVMWVKFDQYIAKTDFLSWAFKIAYFQVLSYQKKAAVCRKYFSQQTQDQLSEVAALSGSDSEESLDALRKCIKELPEYSKTLLSLRYEDSATVVKIAQRMQQSVNTLYKEYQKIHTQLFRCIRKQLAWK
jgi:RNA polymerase sigma-70 factor (ECF subfamily)